MLRGRGACATAQWHNGQSKPVSPLSYSVESEAHAIAMHETYQSTPFRRHVLAYGDQHCYNHAQRGLNLCSLGWAQLGVPIGGAEILYGRGLNKYRPHDRTTTAQHDGTVGRGVRVPSCCAVAGRIPFELRCLHEDHKQDKLMQICISPLIWVDHKERKVNITK